MPFVKLILNGVLIGSMFVFSLEAMQEQPAYSIEPVEHPVECAICWFQFKEGDAIVKLACGHNVHSTCGPCI
jgi:hypothetical protein